MLNWFYANKRMSAWAAGIGWMCLDRDQIQQLESSCGVHSTIRQRRMAIGALGLWRSLLHPAHYGLLRAVRRTSSRCDVECCTTCSLRQRRTFGWKTAKRCQGSCFGRSPLFGLLVEGILLQDEGKVERSLVLVRGWICTIYRSEKTKFDRFRSTCLVEVSKKFLLFHKPLI